MQETLSIPIDRAGRLVLPKSIRDRWGVSEGTQFEVIEKADGIFLIPIPQEPKLVSKEGVLVVMTEETVSPEILENAVQKQRSERSEKLW